MGFLIPGKDEVFFDMLHASVIGGNTEATMKVKGALQAFLTAPKSAVRKQVQALRAKMQATGVSTDLIQTLADQFTVTVQEDNFDLGYESAFREVPLGQGQDFWEIYDVGNSLTFQKVEEGQRIEAAGITGTKATAYVDYYGGAIGWTDKMIRFRKVAAMVDMAMIFRNKFWANKADNFYALLAAAATTNTLAYQGVTADGQLQRDIQTINEGCFQIANRCKDKGYGDTANARFILYYNLKDRARIRAALAATTQALATAGATGDIVDYNIEPRSTLNSNVLAGYPVIVLPGQKIQRAEALAPTTYTAPQDVLTLNQVQAVWAIYGGIVADTDQAEKITLG